MIIKKFNKKGEEDETFSYSFLLKVLIIIIIFFGLIFMIRRVADAFMPK